MGSALYLIAVGLVLLLLCLWWRALRVVGTPSFCTMCRIWYLSADDCHFAPRAIRWYRPHQVGKRWVCNLCIYSLMEASPGSVARVWARAMSWLADRSIFWRLAEWMLVLTIPSRVVTGGNILKRSDDKMSAVTPPAKGPKRRSVSPNSTSAGDSNSTYKKNK